MSFKAAALGSTRHIAVVAAFNLLLAAVALIREVLTVSVLGTSAEADAFFLAYFVPDTLANLLIGAALASAALPAFSQTYARGGSCDNALSYLLTLCLIAGLVVILVTWLILCPALHYVAGGEIAGMLRFSLKLLRITIISVPFYPAALVLVALLQSREQFATASAVPVVFNIVYTAVLAMSAALSLRAETGSVIQSAAVVLSSVAMFMFVLRAVVRSGSRVRFSLSPDDAARSVVRGLSAPLALISSTLILPLVERHVATNLGPGNVAVLNYAFRISQFPVWVFSAAVGSVAFPTIARSLVSGQVERVREAVRSFTGMVVVVACPATLVLLTLRNEIVDILFSFSSAEPPSTAAPTLAMYSMSVLPQSLAIIASKYHLANRSTTLLIKSALASALVGSTVDIVVAARFGLPWTGVGMTLASLTTVAFLLPGVWRTGYLSEAGLWRPLAGSTPFLFAGKISALLSSLVLKIPGVWAKLTPVVVSCILCTALSLVLNLWLRTPEIDLLWQKAKASLLGVQP